MDLNQLYHDHQLLLMRADFARCDASRLVHRVDASAIAQRIETLHRSSGAAVLRNWQRTLAA